MCREMRSAIQAARCGSALPSRPVFLDKERHERQHYQGESDEHNVPHRTEDPKKEHRYTNHRHYAPGTARQFRNSTCFTHKKYNTKRPRSSPSYGRTRVPKCKGPRLRALGKFDWAAYQRRSFSWVTDADALSLRVL